VSLSKWLDSDSADKLMRGVALGRYHALLGAGASFGGASADGRTLPGGVALAEELRDQFNVPSGPANLMRVHESARSRTSVSGMTLPDYITSRFTNTTPPSWMQILTKIHWAGLWTLNIDDCLERAYVQHSSQARQKLVSISWTDRHRTARTVDSEVLFVHLHGKASRAGREGELVFDISGYLNAATTHHRWHRIFGDDYPTAPFLIVGASLESEFDLHSVLSQGHLRSSDDHPSVIVLPGIDDLSADEYRRYGLVPVDATAEEFFTAIIDLLPKYVEGLTESDVKGGEDTSDEAIRFLQQWRRLSAKDEARRDRRHDFYAGHEPEWVDICDELPSRRDVLDRLEQEVKRQGAGVSEVRVLVGDPFSGKSTLLLSLADRLARSGYTPFLFDSDRAPDVPATLWWVQRHARTVLIVDDAEDFAKDVAEIIRQSADEPYTVRVVLADRTNHQGHIDSQLLTLPSATTQLAGRMSNREISSLLEKLEAKRRLGVLTGLPRSEKEEYFKARNRELFSSMAELERGRGFVARVVDEFHAIGSPGGQELIRAVAVASRIGYRLPAKLVKSVCGLMPSELAQLLDAPDVADFVVLRGSTVGPRHRYFGSLVFDECLSQEERFALTARLALALAPHVSPAAIAQSAVEYRMARALMSSKFVIPMAGGAEKALQWYDSLESAFDWNARFWEQRALTAAEAGLFEPAYSWAKQAVIRREDAFSLNTVGVVLMRRALYEARVGQWPTDSFEAAHEALSTARDLEGSQAEYPFDTFFSYTLRLIERVPSRDSALNEQLRNLWMNWQLSLLRLDALAMEQLRERVERANAKWAALDM